MSEVDVVNQALLKLGAQTITSLSDTQSEAVIASEFYYDSRDALQEEVDWNFCTFWETLTQVDPTPTGEFANAYQLPIDWLRILFVGEDYNNPDNYRIEQNLVFTDASTCKIQFIKRIEDPCDWSPMFKQTLIARLQADMAIALTNSRTLEEQKTLIYERLLDKAKAANGSQGRPRRIRSRWLASARNAGPRVAGPTV